MKVNINNLVAIIIFIVTSCVLVENTLKGVSLGIIFYMFYIRKN